jgi:hypothetical protein
MTLPQSSFVAAVKFLLLRKVMRGSDQFSVNLTQIVSLSVGKLYELLIQAFTLSRKLGFVQLQGWFVVLESSVRP